MKVKKVMTNHLAYTTPDVELMKVAEMMANYNVGAIPVINDLDGLKVVGIITDRDIATRVVARGKDPLKMKVQEVMTSPVITIKKGDRVKDVARLMEKNKIRRVPVVDKNGKAVGIVSQADLARKTSDQVVADVVQSVSKPRKKIYPY